MERAMMSAAIERVWNVRINGENFHSVKSIPNFSVALHKAWDVAFGRDKIGLQLSECLRIGKGVGGPKQKRERLEQAFTRVTERDAAQAKCAKINEGVAQGAG